MLLKILGCEVMQAELLAETTDHDVTWDWVSMGLHTHPVKLHDELQRRLDGAAGFDAVVLAFGLCGGAARGLVSPHCPLIVPRAHDCIPMLLGSRRRYDEEKNTELGTFYHTVGWMTGMDGAFGDRSILGDWDRSCRRFGPDKAKSLLKRMYDAYTRVLFVHTAAPAGSALDRSRKIAALLELRHEVTEAEPTYGHHLVAGPWEPEDFFTLAAGEPVVEDHFWTSQS